MQEYGIQIGQLAPEDEGILAHWEMRADDIDVFGVAAVCESLPEFPWSVCINAAEFIDGTDYEDEFNALVKETLKNLDGVKDVQEADVDVWIVDGMPKGEDLMGALARLLVGAYEKIKPFVPSESE